MSDVYSGSYEILPPEGYLDNVVDVISCDDPMDVRPILDVLMERIERVSASLTGDQPLIILIGENHALPAHRIALAGLLERLSQTYGAAMAAGFEFPHNSLGQILNDATKTSLSPADIAAVSARDKDGAMTRTADMLDMLNRYFNTSLATVFNLCDRLRLSTKFNDTAYYKAGMGKYFLQEQDPLTGAVIRKHAPWRDKDTISCTEPVGMYLRNRIMAEGAMEHMRSSGARIYVQHCGNYHVIGDADDNRNQNSLSAIFRSAGAKTLGVLLNDSNFHGGLPRQGIDGDTVLVKGLSVRRDFFDRKDETAYLRDMAARSGLDLPVCDESAATSRQEKWMNDITDWANHNFPRLFPQSAMAKPPQM